MNSQRTEVMKTEHVPHDQNSIRTRFREHFHQSGAEDILAGAFVGIRLQDEGAHVDESTDAKSVLEALKKFRA